MSTAVPLLTDSYLVPWLPELWFGLVMLTVAMYVLLDGIDFGIGMLYSTHESETERETFLAAFGPIWKANKVWLVAFGTMLLAAFPPVYARLLSEHYLLSIAIVIALIFRGVAPKLREQREDERWNRRWDRSFVVGSVLAPFLIGALVGSWVFASGTVSLPSFFTGLLVVSLAAANGAAFLAIKTDGDFRESMAAKGQYLSAAYTGVVVLTLGTVLALDAGGIREAIFTVPVLAIVVLTVVFGIAAPLSAYRRSYRGWFLSGVALALLLALLVAVLLYPTIYPAAGLTISDAVVSPIPLNMVSILGLPVLALVLWYFSYLYRVFSGPVDLEEGYGTESD